MKPISASSKHIIICFSVLLKIATIFQNQMQSEKHSEFESISVDVNHDFAEKKTPTTSGDGESTSAFEQRPENQNIASATFAQNVQTLNITGSPTFNVFATVDKGHKRPEDGDANPQSNDQRSSKRLKTVQRTDPEEVFLERLNLHTEKELRQDTIGKREALKKPEKYTQPVAMIIEMKGKMTEEIGSLSPKSELKQGPVGTDVEEVQLDQIHKGDISRVFLIGNAGEGKTTAAKQYAINVMKNCVIFLKNIRLVLFIPMMKIGTRDTTPFNMLISKPYGKTLEENLKLAGNSWMENNPEEILFIFDGLDQSNLQLEKNWSHTNYETATDPATILANIFSGRLYPGAKIVTTLRWHTFWTLGEDLKPDRIVALRGFSHQQVISVLRQVIRSDPDTIIEHIKKHAPNLLNLCTTPNILLNVASILSQSPEIRPETQTAILGYIVKHLLRAESTPSGIMFIINVAAMAYHGMINGVFEFSSAYLGKFSLQMPDLHELTSTDAVLIPDQSNVVESDLRCHFYHQTIQEYFAALHICNLKDGISSCLEGLFNDAELENVLIFLSGIVCHKQTFSMVRQHILVGEINSNIQEILKEKFLSTFQDGSINNINVCRALQECDSAFIEETTVTVTELRLSEILEPRDSFVISSLMTKLYNLNLVDLHNLELNDSTVTLLAKSIDSIKHLKVYIMLLSSSLSKDHESEVLKVLRKTKLSWIILNCCDEVASFSLRCIEGRNIGISASYNKNLGCATYKLMTAAAPSNLNVRNNSLKEDDVKQLIEGAKESGCKLRQFSFIENRNLTPSTILLLCQFIAQSQAKEIFMADCNLNEKKLEAFYDGLKGHDVELQVLVMDGNKDIGVAGASSLVDFIEHTNLEKLQMRNCNLDDKKMKAMAERSEGKQLQLKEFVMNGNKNIGVAGASSLVDFIQHTNLEQLQMVDCNLDDKKMKAMAEQSEGKQLQLQVFVMDGNKNIGVAGAFSLVDFIQYTNLKKLGMTNCNLDDKKMKAMAERSEGKQLQLQAFRMEDNKNIGVAGASSLVDFIQHTNLEELQMEDCNLDDKRMKAMAERSGGKQLQLERILLSKNRNIGPDGCKHLVDFLKQTKLQVLFIEDCDLTTDKIKAMTAQVKTRNHKIPILDVSKNTPSDSNYMDEMSELISCAGSQFVTMEDCQLSTDHLENLHRNLLQKNKILKELHLSQNTPNPGKVYLCVICKLLHCVSYWMGLRKWRFDDDDLVTLKQELQNVPSKQLQIVFTDACGKDMILDRNGIRVPEE